MEIKNILYNGFLAIREMEGVPFQTKHRMLWEMFSMNGENKDFWRVVGITELAFNKIVDNDYKLPTGNKDNKINRSHITDRIEVSRVMLEGHVMNIDTWWDFYLDNDKCVLATATENKSKGIEVIIDKVPTGLFESKGYKANIGPNEIEFLKQLNSVGEGPNDNG